MGKQPTQSVLVFTTLQGKNRSRLTVFEGWQQLQWLVTSYGYESTVLFSAKDTLWGDLLPSAFADYSKKLLQSSKLQQSFNALTICPASSSLLLLNA